RMVRKKIPEWMNGTMWSTPPPPPTNDDAFLRCSPSTKIPSTESNSDASRLNPAHPPSTASSVPSPSPRPRNGSNVPGGGSGEYRNSVGPSAENLSRQAHLTVENFRFFLSSTSKHVVILIEKVINMNELRSLALQSLPNSPGIRSSCYDFGFFLFWKSVYRKQNSASMLRSLRLGVVSLYETFAWLLAT
ncbi:unnamed protein product, partial [Thlaspi arvense]